MAGHIRTLQKCPKCGGKFTAELLCPDCQTRPSRYFIDLWWQGRLKIYTDPQGYPLDSLARTEQLLATIRHQLGAGKFDPADYVARELQGLRFDNYAAAWQARREREVGRPAGISRSYFKGVKRYVHSYFIPYFGRRSLRELRKAHLLDFKAWLPEHLSLKTVANILGVLHCLFSDALDRKDIALMPGWPKLAKREPRTRWLPLEDQEAVLAHCPEPYRTLYLFCMKHGCRLGEARALKWDLVDLKNKTVTLAAAMDLGVWKPYTKEGDVRHLPLHSEVREPLLALPRSPAGFVFTNRDGRPLSETRVRTHWRRAALKAGLDISCYQATRHSFCTQKLMEGYSADLIMKASGHKTKAAFNRYGKLQTEALRGLIEGEETAVMKKGKLTK